MRTISKTAKLAVAGVSVGTLALSGVAYAYWTTTGTGGGTGVVGTSVANSLTTTGTETTALTPGNSGVISFKVANSQAFAQQISTIHLVSVEAYSTATDRDNHDGSTGFIASCGGLNSGSATLASGADFWMADVTVPVSDGNIAASASAQSLATTGTLNMNNLTGQNQNSCKSAYLWLTFTSS